MIDLPVSTSIPDVLKVAENSQKKSLETQRKTGRLGQRSVFTLKLFGGTASMISFIWMPCKLQFLVSRCVSHAKQQFSNVHLQESPVKTSLLEYLYQNILSS